MLPPFVDDKVSQLLTCIHERQPLSFRTRIAQFIAAHLSINLEYGWSDANVDTRGKTLCVELRWDGHPISESKINIPEEYES